MRTLVLVLSGIACGSFALGADARTLDERLLTRTKAELKRDARSALNELNQLHKTRAPVRFVEGATLKTDAEGMAIGISIT